MRIPFSSADILEKDDRKRILFIDDIFDSWESPTLKPMMELLSEEFCCCRVFKDRRPDSAVTLARNSCIGPYKPNLIVAHGSGATIAAQIKGIEKVLIKPYYNTSNILKDMLGPKKLKARIELPTLEKKEYLTIARSMVLDYKHLEIRALQNGYNNNAHSLFFANDIETIVRGVEASEHDEKDLATVFCKCKSGAPYTGVVQGNTSDLESEIDEMVARAKSER